ncbi:MAG: hypothetical protein H0V38_07465 [Sporichthyaceae bacterium]|nr:hypothetical protein [Sporichthyaceae bacterium]
MSTVAAQSSGQERPRVIPVAAATIGVLSATAVAVVIVASDRVTIADTGGPWELSYAAFLVTGAVLAIHRPGQRVGWAFLGLGVSTLLSSAIGSVGLAIGGTDPSLTVAVAQAVTTVAVAGLFPLILLIFPTGRLLSPRWRWVARIVAANAVLGGLSALVNGPWEMAWEGAVVSQDAALNPFRDGLGGVGDMLAAVFLPVFAGTLIASGVSLIVRYRCSRGDERQQLRWLATATAVFVVAVFGEVLVTSKVVDESVSAIILAAAFSLIPVGAAVAVLKYRLYDIDIVISRGLVGAALAAFITGVYVAIVVGVGSLFGRGDDADPVLSVVAVSVVAVAFQPIRRFLRRRVDRLVFGARATPYEVLAGFARATTTTGPAGDPLPEVAQLLAAGTGAARVTIWLRVNDELRPAATWPPDADPAGQPASGGDAAESSAADHRTEVFHGGELLGAISISKRRGDAVTPADDQLLSDVAAGLGLVLRNRRLVAELADRVDALAASRQRIVSTQDEVRRKFGRDLRAGAEDRLQDCLTRLRLLATEAAAGGASRTASLLDQIGTDTQATITALQDFAGGVYPPVLEAEGLATALRAATRTAAVPVVVHAPTAVRYPREVEAAVYFSVLEALQNAAKYAHASSATVRLVDNGTTLSFEVADDGIGFDPDTVIRGAGLANINDRLDALGGTVSLHSSIGHGTTLRGDVPLAVAVPA